MTITGAELKFEIIKWCRDQFGADYLEEALKVNHIVFNRIAARPSVTPAGAATTTPAAVSPFQTSQVAAGEKVEPSSSPDVKKISPGVSAGAIDPQILIDRLAAKGPGAEVLSRDLIENDGWSSISVGHVMSKLASQGKVEKIPSPPVTYWRLPEENTAGVETAQGKDGDDHETALIKTKGEFVRPQRAQSVLVSHSKGGAAVSGSAAAPPALKIGEKGVLDALCDLHDEGIETTRLTEICKRVPVLQSTVIHDYLQQLESKGYIETAETDEGLLFLPVKRSSGVAFE